MSNYQCKHGVIVGLDRRCETCDRESGEKLRSAFAPRAALSAQPATPEVAVIAFAEEWFGKSENEMARLTDWDYVKGKIRRALAAANETRPAPSEQDSGMTDVIDDLRDDIRAGIDGDDRMTGKEHRAALRALDRLCDLASRALGSSEQRSESPICTGVYAVIAPRGGVLIRNGPDGGELMIYGLEVEAKPRTPKGCTLQRVDVYPSAVTSERTNGTD